jgi:hypothetical protein
MELARQPRVEDVPCTLLKMVKKSSMNRPLGARGTLSYVGLK